MQIDEELLPDDETEVISEMKAEKGVKNVQNDDKEANFNPIMAYSAISIMLLLMMSKNWQQSTLSFFYGFQGVGDKFQNPKYEMGTAFPEMNVYYGMLSGMCFDIPYSICGLLSTVICGFRYRVAVMGLFALFMSCT